MKLDSQREMDQENTRIIARLLLLDSTRTHISIISFCTDSEVGKESRLTQANATNMQKHLI